MGKHLMLAEKHKQAVHKYPEELMLHQRLMVVKH